MRDVRIHIFRRGNQARLTRTNPVSDNLKWEVIHIESRQVMLSSLTKHVAERVAMMMSRKNFTIRRVRKTPAELAAIYEKRATARRAEAARLRDAGENSQAELAASIAFENEKAARYYGRISRAIPRISR